MPRGGDNRRKKVCVLVFLRAGGDCPGLKRRSARGFCKYCFNKIKDVEILGFLEGYAGLMNREYRQLTPADVEGILDLGGTILGTSRQPYKLMTVKEGDGPLSCSRWWKIIKSSGWTGLGNAGRWRGHAQDGLAALGGGLQRDRPPQNYR